MGKEMGDGHRDGGKGEVAQMAEDGDEKVAVPPKYNQNQNIYRKVTLEFLILVLKKRLINYFMYYEQLGLSV